MAFIESNHRTCGLLFLVGKLKKDPIVHFHCHIFGYVSYSETKTFL